MLSSFVQSLSLILSGLKPITFRSGPFPAEPATNAATALMSLLVSVLANDGMPPPPSFTCCATRSSLGCSQSRFGPVVPVERAALSVWQLPQPAAMKTFDPVAVPAAVP